MVGDSHKGQQEGGAQSLHAPPQSSLAQCRGAQQRGQIQPHAIGTGLCRGQGAGGPAVFRTAWTSLPWPQRSRPSRNRAASARFPGCRNPAHRAGNGTRCSRPSSGRCHTYTSRCLPTRGWSAAPGAMGWCRVSCDKVKTGRSTTGANECILAAGLSGHDDSSGQVPRDLGAASVLRWPSTERLR